MTKPGFLRPNLDFSDDEDDSTNNTFGARKISNQIKKTQTNINAIKNPNTSVDETDDINSQEEVDEVVLSEDDSPVKSPKKSNKRKSDNHGKRKSSKKHKRSDSDDEFLPEDENEDSDNDEESVASEDLSDENISDSDFNPNSDEEIEETDDIVGGEDVDIEAQQTEDSEATINLSSDGESPDKKDSKSASKTFDPNSKEFWDKVQELRSKGFSIQQAGNGDSSISNGNGKLISLFLIQIMFHCTVRFILIALSASSLY